MRLKVFFDKFTNTLTVFEDDSGYVFLFFILLFAVFFNAIITFLSFLAYSIILIVLAKKETQPERGAMFLATGSAIMGILYCVLIILSMLRGTNSTAYIIMLQALSTLTAVYSIKFSKNCEKVLLQNWNTEESKTSLMLKRCKTAKHLSIVTLAFLLAFFIGLRIFDAPSPEDTRTAKRDAQIEAQIAESVSIWELDIVESDAIYGSNTKYDSYGNAYSGEYREFCAWTYPGDTFEPRVIVDINEKYEYKRFTGTIFTRPSQDEDLTITFKIFADGKCIFDSGEMRASTRAIDLNLDVTDVDKLTFQAYTDYNDATNPGVVLVNAFLHAE